MCIELKLCERLSVFVFFVFFFLSIYIKGYCTSWERFSKCYQQLSKTILQGKRKKGRPRNNCMHNISKWTDRSTSKLTRMTVVREKWKKFVVDTCIMIPPTIQESRE